MSRWGGRDSDKAGARDATNLFNVGKQLEAGRKERRDVAREADYQVFRLNKSGTTSVVTLPNNSKWGTQEEMNRYKGDLERNNPNNKYEVRKMR